MKIDLPAVLADLEAIVAEKGEDYVYESNGLECVYRDDAGNPSCIVGHVLTRHDLLGIDTALHNTGLSLFLEDDDRPVYDGDREENDIDYYFTGEALTALAIAQSLQDGTYGELFDEPGFADSVRERQPWGVALERARFFANA